MASFSSAVKSESVDMTLIPSSAVVENPVSLKDSLKTSSAEQTNMIRSLIEEQKQTNIYLQSLSLINASRLETEQKQAIINDSLFKFKVEELRFSVWYLGR